MANKKIEHNLECKSELHSKHLCYIVSQGFNLTDAKEYDALIKDPKFTCRHCGRAAGSADNLCEPVEISR